MSVFMSDEYGSYKQNEYIATPVDGKSSYETEQWSTILKNGKYVMIEITTYFRYGEFTLYLTDTEREHVLSLDNVVLTDWKGEFICNNDGYRKYVKIVDKDTYTQDELQEIGTQVHVCGKSDHGPDTTINECDDEADTDIDEGCFYDETLEENGWDLYETIYGFQCKCSLERVVDDQGDLGGDEQCLIADMV